MTIRIEKVQAIVRFYEDSGKADARGPYVGVANIIWINHNRVMIMGMHGKISRTDLHALLKELRNHGVTHVEAERRGKHVTYSLEELYGNPSTGSGAGSLGPVGHELAASQRTTESKRGFQSVAERPSRPNRKGRE